MEDILEFFNLSKEYVKIIMFIFNIVKCTILLVAAIKLFRWGSNKFFSNLTSKIESHERAAQILTLKTLIDHTVQVVIFGIYLMNMLFLFGIDVRPLLATAGVVGVAIGFGAKRFVEDIITGLTILTEGQIRVGDFVEIQGMQGIVEKITLPLITVRAADTGVVHFIRCGYIDTISNYTMNYSYAFFAFDVAYKEDVNHVIEVIKKAFDILKKDEAAKKLILADIEILGLDEFKESSICIKCRIKTQPKGQWTIKRTFNKIIKERFDIENIEIPFNQLVIGQAKDN